MVDAILPIVIIGVSLIPYAISHWLVGKERAKLIRSGAWVCRLCATDPKGIPRDTCRCYLNRLMEDQ